MSSGALQSQLATASARPTVRLAGPGPYLVILVAALLLWAPTLMIDVGRGDSLDYNLVWLNQFSPMVAHGHFYPRWLPGSFGGLGSPAFEFYPPLPFWVTAAVSALTSAWASTLMQLKLAALTGLFLSGVSMRLWLVRLCAPPRALICALIYMAAPYHLVDHYVRGAFAEFFAIGMIPLVALGLLETFRGGRLGPVVLAFGYALLICSHLPVALLTSVMLVGPYGLYLLWISGDGRLGFALKAGAGLAAGVGLAAIYIVPAMTLQDWVSAEYLWTLAPAKHVFTSPQAWADPFQPLLAAIAGIEAAFATMLAWRAWRGGVERTPLAWAALTLIAFVLLSGLVPGVWSIPLMTKVQFPWRGISVEEFSLVTLMALSRWPSSKGLALIAGVLAIANPGVAADLKNLAQGRPDALRVGRNYDGTLLATSTDAAEYLPRGMLRVHGVQPEPVIPLDRLAALPLASQGAAATEDRFTGAVRVRPSLAGGPVVLRRFYFPVWRVRCDGTAVRAVPVGAARLVGFVAPAGAKTCEAVVTQTPQEQLGAALSLASAFALIVYAVWSVRRRPMMAARVAA